MNTTTENSLEPQIQFTLQIEMLSDWHIGSGTGRRGEIDRLVKRDRDGLPYIPAKTLIGIWRDACELVADGLDEGQPHGFFSQLVDCIFGDQPALATEAIAASPSQAALSVRAARLPEVLSNALKSKPLLREAIAFIKPGIKIAPQTGCAVEKNLRFEEIIRGGISLTANCSLNLPSDDDLKRLAYALLVVSTRLIEKIGGKRRRGNGKCCIKIVSVDIDVWVAWLTEQLKSNHPLPKGDKQGQDDKPKSITNNGLGEGWETIRLRIEALSPIIISQRTVGNVVETLDYIPGTHLLKIVCRKLAPHINISEAIAHNHLIVTNATIEISGQRSNPTPFMISGEKLSGGLAKGGTIYNRFIEDVAEGVQPKGERGGYLTYASNPPESQYPNYTKVALIAETHNIVEDIVQRPTENTGGVYTYEVIAEGTVFQAEIHLRKDLADKIAESLTKSLTQWQSILEGEASLGQSKKDDYGRVVISVLTNEVAAPSQTEKAQEIKTLTVWVLSDLLLRDERLRPTSNLLYLQTELEKQIGVDVKLKLPKEKAGITRSHRTESWQVRWQRPRPSLVGIGAGSCIRFEICSGEINQAKLAEIERSGIGERRVEGYGQVSFNHPLLSTSLAGLTRQQNSSSSGNSTNSADPPAIAHTAPEHSYARIIERAAWRKAIQQKALSLAAISEKRKELLAIEGNNPSMSQLGALRSVLSRVKSFDNKERAIAWLDSLESVPNRKKKWHPDSLTRIREYLTESDRIWDDLGLELVELTITETGIESLKGELWAEALFTLVDACIRAHKRKLENSDNTVEAGDRNGS
jgi:CRISPR-associated protein Csx10